MLGHYADHKNKTANQVLQEWDAHGITQKNMTVIRDIIQNELKIPMRILTVYLIPENTHGSTEIFSNAN